MRTVFEKQLKEINNELIEMGELIKESVRIAIKGLVNKELDGIKVLGNGKLTKKLTVVATKFSKSAIEKIQAVGGKIEVK